MNSANLTAMTVAITKTQIGLFIAKIVVNACAQQIVGMNGLAMDIVMTTTTKLNVNMMVAIVVVLQISKKKMGKRFGTTIAQNAQIARLEALVCSIFSSYQSMLRQFFNKKSKVRLKTPTALKVIP